MVILAALLATTAIGPAAPPVSARDIVEVGDISGLRTSPDGRMVAFRVDRASVTQNGYALGWYVAPANGRTAPKFIGDAGGALFTDAGTLETQSPIWSPSSHAIYFRALIGGEVQIWRAPVDGSGETKWTHDAANVRDLALNPDGNALVYHVRATRAAIEAAEQDAEDTGVVVDASVDMAQPIVRGAVIDGKPASQRLTGDWFERGDILRRTPLTSRTLEFAAADQTPRSAAAGAVPASTRMLSRLVVTIDRRQSPPTLVAQGPDTPPATCRTVVCRAERVTSAEAMPDGKAVLVTTADPVQGQTLLVWRPNTGSARTVSQSTGLLNGGRSQTEPCAITATALFCVDAASVSPPRLVRVDVRTGRRSIVFDPNAGFRQRITTTVRALTWQSPDGTRLSGELLVPTSVKPERGFPLVMNYYDCPGFLRGGVGDELPMLPLTEAGIAILCINQPHHDPTKRNAENDYRAALSGITTIVDRLSEAKLVDRRHIGMSGLSFGSEIVMAVAQRSNLLAAAAISTGQPEPGFYWFNSVTGRDTPDMLRRTWQVGDPETDPAGWKRISPALNVAAFRTPLLMQLPEQEARWSMELFSKLSRSATPVEMIAFADEPHVKEQPRHKEAVYLRNLDWFRFWLQGYVDPIPQKAAQYARWKALSAKRTSVASIADRLRP